MSRWPFDSSPHRSTRTKTRVKLLKLIERDGPLCHWCSQLCNLDSKPSSDLFPTLDHLTRRADGGGNSLANLVLACRRCNNERHAPDWKPGNLTKIERNREKKIERKIAALRLSL